MQHIIDSRLVFWSPLGTHRVNNKIHMDMVAKKKKKLKFDT